MSTEALRYVCSRCGDTAPPQWGDQREPGPFLPRGWAEIRLPVVAGHPHPLTLCPVCVASLRIWIGTDPL